MRRSVAAGYPWGVSHHRREDPEVLTVPSDAAVSKPIDVGVPGD